MVFTSRSIRIFFFTKLPSFFGFIFNSLTAKVPEDRKWKVSQYYEYECNPAVANAGSEKGKEDVTCNIHDIYAICYISLLLKEIASKICIFTDANEYCKYCKLSSYSVYVCTHEIINSNHRM